MARTRYAFGLEVEKEDTDGVYKTPTKALCIQMGSDRGSIDYTTEECNIASTTMGRKFDIIMDASNPKATIPINQPLPKDLGGIEDILLSARMKKTTETSPDRDVFSPDSTTSTGLSTLLTALRTSWKAKGGKVTFSISGEVSKRIIFEATINTARDGLPAELGETDNDNTLPEHELNGATDVFYFRKDNPILVNGTTARIKSFKFDYNAQITETDNDTDGKQSVITDFAPTLELQADMANDLKFKASDTANATEFNIVIPFTDHTGAKKGQIIIGKAVPTTEPKISNQDGLEVATITYACKPTNGDDNCLIEIFA